MWATEQTFLLPDVADDRDGEGDSDGDDPDRGTITIGAAPPCTWVLDDPSGRLSRRHAAISRSQGRWVARDLRCKNGMRLDGVLRPKALLEPGAELTVGGLTLVADSPRLVALRGYLARLVGYGRGDLIDLAVRSVRLAATQRAAIALCGDGDLIPLARGLHRATVGADRPFVVCDPRRRAADPDGATLAFTHGLPAVAAAVGGTLVAFPKRLPRDHLDLACAVRDPSHRLLYISCGPSPSDRIAVAAAPILVAPLASRPDDLDPLIADYARDAATALGVTTPFPPIDHAWVREHSATSLPDIEKGTLRLVALRTAGNVSRAAALLGMAHASLGEWMARRRVSVGAK